MDKTASLLIEFLTEELPPFNLFKTIGEVFTNSILNQLQTFLSDNYKAEIIASPRRFGCLIEGVKFTEDDYIIFRKGPPIDLTISNNKPTKAIEGFMNSCNISNIEELQQKDGYFYAYIKMAGKTLTQCIESVINNSLKALPIAKNMRWGNNDFSFIRPVHNLVIMYNNTIIPVEHQIFGFNSTNYTYGHRTLSNGKIIIDNAKDYFLLLEKKGQVIASYQKRRDFITIELNSIAEKLGLSLHQSPSLIDEVTALTEHPVVLQGEFDKSFLKIPQECLILTMEKNQKYFALLNKDGELTNKFLFVANINSKKPDIIVNGNERVLTARLSDAKFFYGVDKKNSSSGIFFQKLSDIIYHGKLGTQMERTTRLQLIAVKIGKLLGVPSEIAEHAAFLMKADLASEMVAEFPELQGIIGKYYALYNNESPAIADAVEQHYYPRFSGDKLPNSSLSITLALADKLEIIIGIWGIGLIPTGDKDPFALRRQALGIVRILLKYNLDINYLLSITLEIFMSFEKIKLDCNILDSVYQFIIQRLANYLMTNPDFSFNTNCVQSICSTNPTCFYHIPSLLKTLEQFAGDKNNQLIIAANKRIDNILKKNPPSPTNLHLNEQLFNSPAEVELYKELQSSHGKLHAYATHNEWGKYFKELEKFNPLVENFFINVMVIDDDIAIRNNRLLLISKLYDTMNTYCRLSELSS